ncbi:hypothetical protein [Clostridium sp. B9]|uniref:hypothetical protein n=1 Tax=Clostridium sp. B9 TaxID=3423224 RepID=UPI003D2F3684
MRKSINEEIKFNYENMQKIDSKYNDLVTDIVCYIRVKLTEKDSEEAINDILDMLLGAQERGENLYDFIGGDYKEFCNRIVEEYRGNNKLYEMKNIKSIILSVIKVAPFFIALNCITELGAINPLNFNSLWNSSFNLKLLPLAGLILSVPMIYLVFGIIISSNGKKKDFVFMFLGNLCYIGILVLIGYYSRKFILISIPNYFICLIISTIVVLIFIIWSIKLLIDSKKGKSKE